MKVESDASGRPQTACRPLAKSRDGPQNSEGAAQERAAAEKSLPPQATWPRIFPSL
jgi:hypothetical protein